jgi:hypothetical protein
MVDPIPVVPEAIVCGNAFQISNTRISLNMQVAYVAQRTRQTETGSPMEML